MTAFPLPSDWRDAILVGRMDLGEGPTPVLVKGGRLFDMSKAAPTVSLLLDDPIPSEYLINLRKAHPNILHCIPSYRPKPGDPDGITVSVSSLPLREQFRRFVENRFQESPSDEVLRLFLELAAGEEGEREEDGG